MNLDEIVLVLVILALAIAAVRGVFGRAGRARWVYLAGLVAGGALGVGVALEAGGLWTLGLALGLGASVVVPAAASAVRARLGQSARRVPRKPGHDEDL